MAQNTQSHETTITFLGVSGALPDVGKDAASFLINGKYLVDTGWYSALKMRQYGYDPLNVECIFITHLHQDHYIGLPHILFYGGLSQQAKSNAMPLKIIGPAEDIERVVTLAVEFLQIHRYPELAVDYEVVRLSPGQTYATEAFELKTCATRHFSGRNVPIQGLAYRFTDKATGAEFAFTGDTSFHPSIADLARNAPLLIHDVAHTAPEDAARIARQAQVRRLGLIHYADAAAEQALATAKEVFPNTFLAREGETLRLFPAR